MTDPGDVDDTCDCDQCNPTTNDRKLMALALLTTALLITAVMLILLINQPDDDPPPSWPPGTVMPEDLDR